MALMALMAIWQHHGRPHTPTDQAHIESFFGHIKGEWPHLEKIADPAVLGAELARVRIDYNKVRLHAGIGYVTQTTSTTAEDQPSVVHARRDFERLARTASTRTTRGSTETTTTVPRTGHELG